ncbi:hypothetical protein NPN23_24300, partial [Vibrio parahaemolyticus]|nr:hypothetical protein [Vibrio parahaemolyticus]
YMLLLALSILGIGFKWATADKEKVLFDIESQHISGIMIGIEATAQNQSTTTVTAISEGFVPAALPVETPRPSEKAAQKAPP